jgi:hypothetical protein
VLECHVDYVVSQCERTHTRAMAHRTAAVDVPSEATARSLPSPLPCTSVTSITELMLSFGTTGIEAAEAQGSLPRWLERWETRDRVLGIRTPNVDEAPSTPS